MTQEFWQPKKFIVECPEGFTFVPLEPTAEWLKLATGPMSGNELCDNINEEDARRVYLAVIGAADLIKDGRAKPFGVQKG